MLPTEGPAQNIELLEAGEAKLGFDLVRQLGRLLAGKALQPFVYRDFGSLVSLGHYSTVRQPDGFPGRQEHADRRPTLPG